MRLLFFLALLFFACAAPPDAREAEVVDTLTQADQVLLQSRPVLTAGKYAQMATAPYEFYRGNLALFRHDWEAGTTSRTSFFTDVAPVWGIADPHPENFGVLLAEDGTLGFEPNDLDSADRVPALFDVRRLVGGLALGVKISAPDVSAHDVALAAAQGYAQALIGFAHGAGLTRIDSPGDGTVLKDIFKRANRELAARSELTDFTVVDASGRHFKQGIYDPTAPTGELGPVPAAVRAALPGLLARLGSDPAFTVLDVAREYGAGVSSWPRVRVLVLLRGATDAPDDDLMLEVKEETESGVAGWYAPTLSTDDVAQRVENAARRAWSRPDAEAHYFCGALLGVPVQVRTEANAQKSVRVTRWLGDRGTRSELVTFATLEGALLARIHARSEPATVALLAAQLSRAPDVFAEEQAAFADAHADLVLADYARFLHALATRGPTLGVTRAPDTTPASDAEAFFGSPP